MSRRRLSRGRGQAGGQSVDHGDAVGQLLVEDDRRVEAGGVAGVAGGDESEVARHGCDLVLPLSDHADFDELVRTARESGASKVYTVHGAPRFAAHLRAIGIDAEHLAEHPQSAMEDEPEASEPNVGPGGQLGLAL